jgi:hypothetical protein
MSDELLTGLSWFSRRRGSERGRYSYRMGVIRILGISWYMQRFDRLRAFRLTNGQYSNEVGRFRNGTIE